MLQCSQKTPTKRTYRNHEYRSFCEHTRQLLKVTIRAVVVGPASHSGPFPADCTFCPAVWSPGEFRHGRWLCQDSLHTEKAEEGGGVAPSGRTAISVPLYNLPGAEKPGKSKAAAKESELPEQKDIGNCSKSWGNKKHALWDQVPK